jgi:predicted nucleotidyltransferase component of viral defense system
VSPHRTANLAASVHQPLLNLSEKRGENFNLLLTQFAIERFLYRLSRSLYVDQFVLKGALVFRLWQAPSYRPTRDLDLLGFGASSQDALSRIIADLCGLEVEADGITYDPASLLIREIREDQIYGGQRVELMASLGQARIPLQIDIGFGDVLTPDAETSLYPTLLPLPAPEIRGYPRETVIAEKVQAMVALGMLNSRMKDFYDVWSLSQHFAFGGSLLCRAIRATFNRRATPVPPSVPVALTPQFTERPDKVTSWEAFVRRNLLDAQGASLAQIGADLAQFLIPVLAAAEQGKEYEADWSAGGPWIAREAGLRDP